MILLTCPYTTKSNGNHSIIDALGNVNLIALHVAKKDVTPYHTAPLSIKFVLNGAEMYECGNHILSVDPYKYLIINKDQGYSSAIDSKNPTSSFCVFFSNRFISDGYRFANRSNEYLLDNAPDHSHHEIDFDQKLYWKDDRMSALLKSFSTTSDSHDEDLKADEWCSKLLELLLISHQNETLQRRGLKAAKISTKKELFKRLSSSIDFIHEYYSSPISLTQLSQVSCLSSFHFLRAFRQAFNVTPHQYITTIRLKHACQLLRETDAPVYDICTACGFQDESSFIRLFKIHFKITPGHFRKQFFCN